MDPDVHQLAALFRNISTQLRGTLSNFHLAAGQLVPAADRELNPILDAKAAVLDQGYYQLLRLVNDLSAVSSLYAGPPLLLQDCDIVELIRTLCLQADDLAAMIGLKLQFLCNLDRHICAVNRDSIEQLLFHLLSNAFKFTPAGGSVSVELKISGNRVLLSVCDTGCGIDEHLLPVLFDRYLHEISEEPLPGQGLGLGLFLCHRIAEAHGGSIMAESRAGKGTRFTVSLPDRQAGSPSVSDVPNAYSNGFNKILMALSDALPSSAFLLRNQD
ncbi:Histidine kinase-, DNA gyrase B-, and HSP90-like ATPase [Oscillibacter sp. PC13]|uniref:sensor histidine kinase n=1 Tax=Oscillibacter sp. PC13 TaxID=1855299 RepID=UPI0008EAF365|nr:sensor histidine kinase [Oscillibacter sp. PC13]SFP26544.1 Histidine kinase-, DNA gyrase B-, and HSP90-like ATPase [Oscillibacter sp. PC13]